jgi:cell division transport system permease protein
MKSTTALKRAYKTTSKQINRGGWLTWASISIMTLAFLVISLFVFLVIVSQLFLKSLENSPHIYVFFKTETEERDILQIKQEWEKLDNIDFIDYTSEEEAKEEFAQHNEINNNPLIAEEIQKDERELPASLALRLISIESAQDIIELVEQAKENNDAIYDVRYSREVINNIRDVVTWLRVAGIVILSALIIVIFFFTLVTVEFRTYSRSKEIGIMQLVGGSLWYIRLPFIIEGGIYGAVGAFISNMILIIFAAFAWYSQATASTKSFLIKIFGDLDWPTVSIFGFVAIFVIIILAGFLVGSLTSVIAIKRYIK